MVAHEKYSMISFINGNFQFFNLSSNCQMQLVVEELQKILKPDMVNIIAGNFNFDKGEKMTRFFLNKMMEGQLIIAMFQTISKMIFS